MRGRASMQRERKRGRTAPGGRRTARGPGVLLAGLALAVFPPGGVQAQTPAPTQGVDPFADPRVRAIESQLRCSCGCNLDAWTCQRQMACEVSPSMAARVRERLAQGADAAAILAEFVAERGEEVLMAPPKEGFNWAGYLAPFVALGVGGVAVVVLLRRWSRGAAAAVATVELDAGDLARIEAELARLAEDL